MKMKLALGAVVALATAAATTASAEAISFGSSYTIAGQGSFTPNLIDFFGDAKVVATSGDFNTMAPLGSNGFAIVAMPETFDITVPGSGKLVNFEDRAYAFFGVELLKTFNDYDFNVTSATFLPGTNVENRRYRFTGTFGDGTQGIGELAQLVELGNSGVFGYSATFTAVPTPALLPGLVGMGLAALRRKKSEEAVEENA